MTGPEVKTEMTERRTGTMQLSQIGGPIHRATPAGEPARGRSLPQGAAAAVVAVLVGLLTLVAPGAAHAAGSAGDTPPGKAWVRVGHFVPGMGAASIEIQPIGGGTTMMLAPRATYGEVSQYRQLVPGSYTVTVRMSDASTSSTPMLSRSLKIHGNQARTVAVLGTAKAPRLAVLTDDLTPPAQGSARVRLLSASDQTEPLTVSAVDGPTIASDAVQGQATGYATVPAGDWTLDLTSDAGSAAMASLQSVPITAGSVYTVVVLDSGDGVKLDVVTDAAGATKAPRGGAHTGLGGMATGHPLGGSSARSVGSGDHDTLLDWVIAGAVVSAAAAGAGRLVRRRARLAR